MCDIPASQGRGVCHAPQPKKLHRVCPTLSLHVSTAGSASAMKECGPPIPVQIVVLGKCGNSCRARKRKPGSMGPGVLGSRGQIAENPTLGTWKGDGRKYRTWTRAPFPERSSTVPSEFTYKFKDQTVKHFKMVITDWALPLKQSAFLTTKLWALSWWHAYETSSANLQKKVL